MVRSERFSCASPDLRRSFIVHRRKVDLAEGPKSATPGGGCPAVERQLPLPQSGRARGGLGRYLE